MRGQILWRSLVLLALVGCRDACDAPGTTSPAAQPGFPEFARQSLALVPEGAKTIVAIDFDRFRAAPGWQRLSALAARDQRDRELLQELTARTGLDPLKDVASLLAAFPDDARVRGQFAVVLTGRDFDERRLVTFARDQASLRGSDLVQQQHADRRLWVSKTNQDVGGFFLDNKTFALGRAGWAQAMADLAAQATTKKSALDSPELVNLVGRILAGPRKGGPPALWAAALVPTAVREAIGADPEYASASALTRLAGSLDLESAGPKSGGLVARVLAEMSTAGAANALATRVRATLQAAQSNPRVLLLGLAPYLEGIEVHADGPGLTVSANLTAAQVDGLLERAEALIRMTRAASGAGRSAPGDSPPP